MKELTSPELIAFCNEANIQNINDLPEALKAAGVALSDSPVQDLHELGRPGVMAILEDGRLIEYGDDDKWTVWPDHCRFRAMIHAETALQKMYGLITGEYCDEDFECAARDMLTEIMHLCDRQGWDFSDMEEQARQSYLAELDPLKVPEPTNKA